MRRVLLIGQGPTARARSRRCWRASTSSDSSAAPPTRSRPSARARRAGARRRSPEGSSAAVRERRPDCVVVSSYDRILPARLLERCPFVNVHYAPLPEYRGAPPSTGRSSTARRRRRSPCTCWSRSSTPAPSSSSARPDRRRDDTVAELYARLNAAAASTCWRPPSSATSTATPARPRTRREATYTLHARPGDGEIDWNRPTADVYALVRALDRPLPGRVHLPRRPPAGDLASGAPPAPAPLGGPGARPRGRPARRRGLGRRADRGRACCRLQHSAGQLRRRPPCPAAARRRTPRRDRPPLGRAHRDAARARAALRPASGPADPRRGLRAHHPALERCRPRQERPKPPT